MASVPGDNRLVVIVLRGAMDGLDVVRPVDGPAAGPVSPRAACTGRAARRWSRGSSCIPALDASAPLWDAGELSFAHAVSTPYRDKRSHFDGQDILEAGTPGLARAARDGWLNRLLAAHPRRHRRNRLCGRHRTPR